MTTLSWRFAMQPPGRVLPIAVVSLFIIVVLAGARGGHHVRGGPHTRQVATSLQKAPSYVAADHRDMLAAYARQRKAADSLLEKMRAEPDAWSKVNGRHSSGALWVDPFRDFYRCPGIVEKVGSMGDGGKWVCGVDTLLQKPGCVVYSFGSNGDTSFEEAILEHTACSVWTFDPTLNEEALRRVLAVPGMNFTSVGLSNVDGELALKDALRPVRTLRTLMKERGHEWVDLLKMDIDHAEWPVLNAFIDAGTPLPVTQAQIEFHMSSRMEAVETMAGLIGLGMRVFHVEENNYCRACAGALYEFALVNVDSSSMPVTDSN